MFSVVGPVQLSRRDNGEQGRPAVHRHRFRGGNLKGSVPRLLDVVVFISPSLHAAQGEPGDAGGHQLHGGHAGRRALGLLLRRHQGQAGGHLPGHGGEGSAGQTVGLAFCGRLCLFVCLLVLLPGPSSSCGLMHREGMKDYLLLLRMWIRGSSNGAHSQTDREMDRYQ